MTPNNNIGGAHAPPAPLFLLHCLNNEKRFFSSKRVFFFQISPSDLLALILFFNSRLQKYSITTIHHDEKHDFFFHLVEYLSA